MKINGIGETVARSSTFIRQRKAPSTLCVDSVSLRVHFNDLKYSRVMLNTMTAPLKLQNIEPFFNSVSPRK